MTSDPIPEAYENLQGSRDKQIAYFQPTGLPHTDLLLNKSITLLPNLKTRH